MQRRRASIADRWLACVYVPQMIRCLSSSAWLIVGVAFALRALTIHHESLWRDEVDSVRFALQPLSVLLGSFVREQWNGAFYTLALRGWLALAGDSPFALRYFSVCFGVMQVALAHAVGRRALGARAGLSASWLMALSPTLIWYAAEGKMYTLQPTLILAAAYVLLRAQQRWHWVWFVALASVSFYTHLLSPLFVPVAAALVWTRPHLRAQWRRALVALGLLTLPYLPLLAWQAPLLARGGESGHPFVPLPQMIYTLLTYWTAGLSLSQALPAGWASGGALLVVSVTVGLIAYALVAAWLVPEMRPHRAALWGFLVWVVLPVLLLYGISTRYPLFNPRYLLWTAPAFYLLLGGAVVLSWRNRLARGALIVVLSAVSLLGLWAQIAHPVRPEIRQAAACVLRRLQETDRVIFQIPYGQHGLAYYVRQQGKVLDAAQIIEAPFTNHGMSAAEVALRLETALGDARRFWLYETEPAMWDARGLVRQWADQNARLILRCDFRGASAALYRR